jgi:hypothetical protein
MLDPVWIGDFSFEVSLLLNPSIRSGYDWDKKLALKCGGGARLLVLWISEALPCFTYDLFYMKYSKKNNYYEVGPLRNIKSYEQKLLAKFSMLFQSLGYFFVTPQFAQKKVSGLFSDCRGDGNASIFDVLFSDTYSYHNEIERFADKDLVDPTGTKIRWSEYYYPDMSLKYREEYRYFPSKNVERIEFDPAGMISKVKVWRNIGKKLQQEFLLDIEKEFKKREKKIS